MKKLCKTLFCLLVCFLAEASTIDSLWQLAKNEEMVDTVRFNALRALGEDFYADSSRDSLVIIGELMLPIAKKLKDNLRVLEAYNNLGSGYSYIGEMDKAFVAFDIGIKISKIEGEKEMELSLSVNRVFALLLTGELSEATKSCHEVLLTARALGDVYIEHIVLNILGEISYNTGDELNALKYYQESLIISKEDRDSMSIAYNMSGIAEVHYKLENYEQAKEIAEEVISYSEQIQLTELMISNYFLLGDVYQDNGEKENALKYYREALKIAKNLNYRSAMITGNLKLANFYFEEKSYSSAKNNVEEAYSLAEMSTQESFMANVFLLKGEIAQIEGKYKSSVNFCEQSYHFALAEDDIPNLSQICECLYKSEKERGEFKKAMQWLEEKRKYDQKLFNNEKTRKITQLTMQYDFDQEREQIAYEQQIEEDKLKLETIQTRMVTGGVGILALFSLGLLLFTRKKNKEVAEKNRQLSYLNTTKDRLFAIIGHDLRKPALSFQGIAEKVNYLIHNQNFEQLNKLGDEIEQSALSLIKLTDNLLKWALMQRDVLPYDPVLIKLGEVTEEVLAIFNPIITDEQLSVTKDIPTNLEIYADVNSLRTIIRNLMDNAIKYTPQNGKIEIITESTKDGLVLKIRDEGLGMSEDQLATIFLLEKDKSTKGVRGESGTGLGLHIVHELVEKNKGTIQAFSELGKGTTFEILLPKYGFSAS